jgi:fibronectin type 3 domain-containing protein
MKQMKQLTGWFFAAFLSVALLALAGCGGGSSSTPAATKTTSTGVLSVTGGNSGAAALTVAAPAGVTLSIPANTALTDGSGNPVSGSLDSSVSYSTSAADLPAAAQTLPSGATLVAFADVTLATPSAQVRNFSQPVALGFQIPAATAAVGDALVVYSFDGTSGAWSFAGTELVDANRVLPPAVNHLSIWGVFKSAAPQPVKPVNVTALDAGTQVTLSWDAVTGATGYNIYYQSTPGASTSSTLKVSGSAATQVVPNLTNGNAYYFVVTAVNASGESLPSGEVSVIPAVPTRPSGIGASAGNAQVTVTWKNVVGATSYNVYYGTAAGVTTSSPNKITGALNGVTGQVVADLLNETTYSFVVTAVNAGGESVISSEKAAKPSLIPQPPVSPTGVTATAGTGQVTVVWTDTVLNAESYNVYYVKSATAPTPAAMLAGVKISSTTSPKVVTDLTAGTYYFSVTSVNAIGESAGQPNPKKAVVL